MQLNRESTCAGQPEAGGAVDWDDPEQAYVRSPDLFGEEEVLENLALFLKTRGVPLDKIQAQVDFPAAVEAVAAPALRAVPRPVRGQSVLAALRLGFSA